MLEAASGLEGLGLGLDDQLIDCGRRVHPLMGSWEIASGRERQAAHRGISEFDEPA